MTDFLGDIFKKDEKDSGSVEDQLKKELDGFNDKTEKKAVEEKPEPKVEVTPKEPVETPKENTIEIPKVEVAPEKVELPEELDFEHKDKSQIATYNDVKIYKIKHEPLLHYEIPTPKASSGEQLIVNTIKEAATRIIAVAPYRIRDEQQRRNVYFQKIMEIIRASPELKIPNGKMQFYADAVVREMVGYGKIDQLLKDELLEEIMIIGPKKPVYVFHRQYEMMTTNIVFYSDKEVQDVVGRIARFSGRRIDYSQPLLDARLADGSRVNATIPPSSVSGSTLTIRKFRKDPYTIIDMINYGTLDVNTGAFLWVAVEGFSVRPANLIISGGTGSGKTTTLNVLSSFVPEMDRVISIEDTAELNLPLKHWIRLESRPPGIEGTGEITLDMLTKNALRMRPDRIIVGEVRSQEAESLFTAMNTGHDGSMGTLHANSSQETLIRITSPPMSVPQMMLSGLNLIVVQNRLHDRKKGTIRRVTEIAEVSGVLDSKPQVQKIFEWNPRTDKLQDTGVPSKYLKLLSNLSGKTVQEIEKEIKSRAEYLKMMVEKNIRGKDEVNTYFKKYFEI